MRSFFKLIGIMVMSTVLTSITINATDHFNNFSQSAVGLVATTLVGEIGPCEKGMVFVTDEAGGFCIDQYEASPSKECVHHDPHVERQSAQNLEYKDCIPISQAGTFPWRNITRHQAALACRKVNKRLPSNREWYLASLGTPDGALEVSPLYCNTDRRGASLPETTGTFAQCVSGAGVYDMIGNVWEWVTGTVEDGFFGDTALPDAGYVADITQAGIPRTTAVSPPTSFFKDYFWIDATGIRGMLRGGFWGSVSDSGMYAVNATVEPSFSGQAVGFRCVR